MNDLPLLLYFLIFLAGFIDSIAGGGGLVSLTAYYAYGLPPVNALANNKFSSTFGTAFATVNYARNGAIAWRSALVGAALAVFGATVGANLALLYSDYYFRYAMMIIIPFVTLFTIFRKDRKEETTRAIGTGTYVAIAAFSFLIGVYDGFFGPGTGMFLTLAFSLAGFSMICSVGNCKVVNLTSNVVSLAIFVMDGSVDYALGIPCAICSIAGGLVGSQMALKMEKKIIRPMLLLVLALLYLEILDVF